MPLEQSRLRALGELSGELFIELDSDGRFTWVSNGFMRATGLSEADLIGQSFSFVLHPDDVDRVMASWNDAITRSTGGDAFRIRAAGEGWRQVSMSGMPFEDDEVGWRAVGILRIESGSEQLRQALDQLGADLEQTQRIAHTGSWRLDLATGRYRWSPQMYAITGQDAGTFTPTLDAVRSLDTGEDPAGDRVVEAHRRGNAYSIRHRIRLPDGRTRCVEDSGEPVHDSDGLLVGFVGTLRDITEEVEREQEMQRQRDRLERAQAISQTGDIEVDIVTGEVWASPEFRRLFDVDPGEPATLETFQARVHPADRDAIAIFWRSPRRAVEMGEATYRVLTGEGSVRYLRGRAQIRQSASTGHEHIIAFAQDVTASVLAERDLRRSEQRLRSAEAIAHVGAWEWDIATGEVDWTDEVYRIFGFAPQEQPATYELFLGHVHPADREHVTRAVDAAVNRHEPYEVRHRVVRPDGAVRVVHERGEVARDEAGRAVRMLGVVQDVTETVEAEEQLRTSEARLRAAVDLAGLGNWSWDVETGEISWSPETYRLYGQDPATFKPDADNFLDLIHPDDREIVVRANREVLRTGSLFDAGHRVLRADGSIRVLRRNTRVVEWRDGRAVRVLGTVLDVTDTIEAAERLRESESRRRLAIDISHMGYWEWNLRNDTITWSPETYRIHGFDPEGAPPTGDEFPRWVHPDDLPLVQDAMRRALRGETEYDIAHRILRPDGSARMVHTLARVVEWDGKRPVRMLGTLRDITEQAEREAELRRLSTQLNHAQEIATLGSYDWTPATGDLWWSDQVYRIFGWAPGSFRPGEEGYTAQIHPSDRDRVVTEMARSAERGESYDIQFRAFREDGVEIVLRDTGRVERGLDGRRVVRGAVQDITETARRQRELERVTVLLEQASSMARLAPYEWDPGRDTRWWSPQLYEVLGVAADTDPGPRLVEDLLHPDDRARVVETFAYSSHSRESWDMVYRVVRPDGETRVLRDLGGWSTAEDGHGLMRGSIQDITELVELREQATDATAEVINIIDASLLPIIVVDERGTVQRANAATERTFGWPAGELVGQDVGILANEVDRAAHARYMDHYLATGEASTREGLVIGRTREVRARRRDGTEFPAQLTVAEARLGSGRRQFVGIMMDLTEQRATEEHLRQIQKSEALGTLVAGVAHDFNNLLTAIRGGLDMAVASPGEDRWIQIALQATDRAAEVVRQLLRFSRREEPQQISMEACDLVHEAVVLSRETIDRRVWFYSDCDDDLPPLVGDPGQMGQVLMNLIVNARDAVLERAEREPGAYQPEISLNARSRALDGTPGVVFEVRDNGVGMAEEVRQRALDPFFTTKSADRGTGLGLAAVAGIVDQHHGRVMISSEEGQGATVAVWLPASVESDEPDRFAEGPVVSRDVQPEEHPTVLLVDDEEALGQIGSAYLGSAGFQVIYRQDGTDAITEVRHRSFDLAILDLNMPSPNGWEVLAAIREIDPDLPVVIASGFADEDEVLQRGAQALVSKPYGRTQLVNVAQQLARRGTE